MEGLELICFEIIAAVGTARSAFVEAIQEAKNGNFEAAEEKVNEGNEMFTQGHHAHAKLIQAEAASATDGGEKAEISLLLIHAEDQLMSAEAFKILSTEFIDIYKRLEK